MNKRISRRQLLMVLAATVGGAGLGKLLGSPVLRGIAQELNKHLYLPLVRRGENAIPGPTTEPTSTSTPTSTPTDTVTPTDTPTSTSTPESSATPTATPTSWPGAGAKVVHVHSTEATSWDFGDDYYGDFVDQDVVNAMVDRGVIGLTGAPSLAQAWQTLVPNYAPGKAIAIKVNFNNGYKCASVGTGIDALVHPINSLIRGLLQAYPNFQTSDIWVYEATKGGNPPLSIRTISGRFKDGCLYPGVRFFDKEGCHEEAGYSSTDPTADIIWRNPGGIPTPPPAQVTDVLVNATYVINMPIMKAHGGFGVTLSFKNHFGSIAECGLLHDYGTGTPTYSPLVDIYRNPHILDKTVLTIGDALFGNWRWNLGSPEPWSSFGNGAPNSLLFATDPVAIDSVMTDLIGAERFLNAQADNYLEYAAAVGLGTYERGDPWGSGYNRIGYVKIELQHEGDLKSK